MVITDTVELPTYDELNIQEVNVTSPYLRASGAYFGKYCDEQSKVKNRYAPCDFVIFLMY